MSNAQHTPGVWIFNSDENTAERQDGVTIAAAYDLRDDKDGSVVEANARLIAAAPDLLEALERILYAHDNHGNGAAMGEAVLCRAYAEQARAAIAKAKGE